MNMKWLAALILLVLLGFGFFLITNCGSGTQLANITPGGTQGWQYVGTPGFTSTESQNVSLSVAGGTPIVAAYIEGGYTQAMRFNGTSWESIAYIPQSARVFPLYVYNGVPYIVCNIIDSVNKMTETRVFKYEGGTWETLAGTIDVEGNYAYYCSLFVYNGTPFLAYYNSVFGVSKVYRYTGSAWESLGNVSFTGDIWDPFSLFVYDGTPYLAFSDFSAGTPEARVLKFNGSDWEDVGEPGLSTGGAASISLFIYNGTPYLAFTERNFTVTIGGHPEITPMTTVLKFNGTSWEAVGQRGFSGGDAIFLSLFVYNGTPYLAFKDRSIPGFGRASLMKYNGSSWDYVGGQGFSGDLTTSNGVDYTSLYIYNGIPYVAYMDKDNGKRISVMKYIP